MKDLSGSGRQPMGVGDAKERAALRTALSTGGALMLVLDNVWSKKQLHWLLACDDTEDPRAAIAKMPPGSRVLLASRSRDIVTVPGMAGDVFPLSLLDDTSAVKLLCQEALKQPQPPATLETPQLRQALAVCGGLPLALRVLGRQLRGVKPEDWQVTPMGLSIDACSTRSGSRRQICNFLKVNNGGSDVCLIRMQIVCWSWAPPCAISVLCMIQRPRVSFQTVSSTQARTRPRRRAACPHACRPPARTHTVCMPANVCITSKNIQIHLLIAGRQMCMFSRHSDVKVLPVPSTLRFEAGCPGCWFRMCWTPSRPEWTPMRSLVQCCGPATCGCPAKHTAGCFWTQRCCCGTAQPHTWRPSGRDRCCSPRLHPAPGWDFWSSTPASRNADPPKRSRRCRACWKH